MKISEHYQDFLHSKFKEDICGLIQQRQALGFKYESQIHMLISFDRYICEQYEEALVLTKGIAESWAEAGITIDRKRRRAILIRQFGEYLNQNGKTAYLHPKRKYKPPQKYVPYIFTTDQIKTIFQYADNSVLNITGQKRKETREATAVILKMLYGCGLRISEALHLKIKDIDLKTGVLKIWDSKFHKDRLVPMSATLRQSVEEYSLKILSKRHNNEEYVFSVSGEKPYTPAAIYSKYREIIFGCGIPHRGKGYGPRLHDFRHTFAVHSLRHLADSGEDLYTILPILSKYMGHSSVSATQYYLRLTAEMYPDVINKMELHFSNIFPEVFEDE